MNTKSIIVLVMSLVAVVLSILNLMDIIKGRITLTEFLLGQILFMLLACTAAIIAWIPQKNTEV